MVALLATVICLAGLSRPVAAQTAGEGSLQGTVTDTSGAVVPNAKVTATNTATSISTVRDSTGAGFFNISPLQPGTYAVEISAKGFKTLVQDNVVVDALQMRTISPVLAVGTETQTVTVTAAPPVLDTADATLGLTVENDTYSNLPIQMNNQQRDPTAFGTLTPGAQGGARLPIIGGTGNYLGQLYLDGMPATTVNQQGDNRVVSLSMSIEAVDQFQVLTSTPPAEYMGAGAENFTMKSGGLQYHGQVSDFVRNTAFDTWGFTSKAAHHHDPHWPPRRLPNPSSTRMSSRSASAARFRSPATSSSSLSPTTSTTFVPVRILRSTPFRQLPCSAATSLSCSGYYRQSCRRQRWWRWPYRHRSRQSRLPFRPYVPPLALVLSAPVCPFRASRMALPPTT